MHNKKGKINNPDNHIPWRNRGFYFEDYNTPKYKYKDQQKYSEVKLSLNNDQEVKKTPSVKSGENIIPIGVLIFQLNFLHKSSLLISCFLIFMNFFPLAKRTVSYTSTSF